MLITLIGKNSINKLILPKEVIGNYWLYDESSGKKMINIESVNNNWIIKSTYQCKIINDKNIVIDNDLVSFYKNGNEFLDKVVLKKYNNYYITLGDEKEIYVLYYSPVYEDNYFCLHMKNTSTIFIGKEKSSNHIVYNNPLVNKVHANIYFLNGIYWIKNYDKRFNTYVNDKPVSDSTMMLNNGDRIYICGLTIILMNKELFINNPLEQVKCNNNYFDFVNHSNVKLLNLQDDEFYNQSVNNYFLRAPRILDLVEQTEMKILTPKISESNRELPAALVLGSTISMGAMTVITVVQTVSNFFEGKSNVKSLIFSLMMSTIMFCTSVLIPIFNKRYSAKIKKLNEKDTIEKYKKYIEKKINTIKEILDNTSSILYKTYVTPEECMDIIFNNTQRLWERKISEEDFLTVRLGVGDIPSNIKMSYTIDETSDSNHETYKLMLDCIEKSKIIKDVPVLFSFVDKKISGIIYEEEELKYKYIQNLLLQLLTFQSYDELKIVFLLNDNKERKWDFVKMLPHVWSNSKKIRFFADESIAINEISQYLENELIKRINKEDTKDSYKDNLPYYLIIVDDYKTVESLPIIKDILKIDKNMGFSILFITDSILKLPNECKTFIEIKQNRGVYFENENPNQNRLDFSINVSETFFFDRVSTVLSDILIKYNEEKEMQLPSSYTFLEMYNVGCIEQLNILERWNTNDSTISLNAPIGIDGEGKHISLDIHEKFHGPHGLVAGSTGSGKSEFIITYILSLAINYHPDDVAFVLIDYKGGGLVGAFLRPDVQLPHVIGTITNIDKSSLQRSLESIESELKRRQVMFNEAKFVTGESTIDIYKYQKYYHNGILKDAIPHLFIICDEFAELKQQEPDFMDELISIARIGRSLGVHLILATQKPTGIVNDQIRSNLKFGVCLKVQTPSDSREIIDISDAAKLTGAGQFYFKVGNADYIVLGQSAWAGALYYPSDEVKKEYDNSVEFISNTGKILKKVDDTKKNISDSRGEQLTNLVKYLSDLAKRENLEQKTLWLNPIPETIYVGDIRNKYNVKIEKNIINPVIGEYDDPSRQLQNVMTLNLSSGGNTIIYGNAESGKETLLSTMIYDIISNYSSDVAQMYILDFGTETMKIFKDSYHVGDVILANESEKIARFFIMLQKELKDRKQILSNYNGDYNLYLKSSKKSMPTFIIILNNYESYIENYPNIYDDVLETLLREGLKYGIVFVFTVSTTSSIRYRMGQNFRQRIALQMNKDSDYPAIFDYVGKKRPSRLFGRGLVTFGEKQFYEYQVAKICEPEFWNEQIKQKIEEQNRNSIVQAKEIPVVPNLVTIGHLESYLKDLSNLPIGILNKTILPAVINLKNNLLNLIISNNTEDYVKFITNMIEEIRMLPNVNLLVLDSDNILYGKKEDLKDKYIQLFKKLNNTKKVKDTVCIIIGIGKFLTELGSEELFFESLKNAQSLKKCSYIIIDSYNNINNYLYSDWYKEYLTNNTGLWLGNGVNEQYILKTKSSEYKLLNTCGNSYGYIFTKGKPELLKLLGMKENGEENE